MKKIFRILAVFMLFYLVSCKKERNCTCDYTAQMPVEGTPGTDILPLGKVTKSEAEESCSSWQQQYETNPYYITVSCSSK